MLVCQNFRHLNSTVKKSCCPRTNTTGRIQMHWLGTSRRSSIDFHRDFSRLVDESAGSCQCFAPATIRFLYSQSGKGGLGLPMATIEWRVLFVVSMVCPLNLPTIFLKC